MQTKDILGLAVESGVYLYVEDGKLKFKSSEGAFTDELKSLVKENKQNIVELLEKENEKKRTVKSEIKRRGLTTSSLSFSQKRLWYIDQLEGGSSHYNMPIAMKIKGSFNIQTAEEVLTGIVKRHEIFRTTYHKENGNVLQRVNPSTKVVLNKTNLTSESELSKSRLLKSNIEADALKPFDLSNDLMLRASWIQLEVGNTEEGVLLFNMHHIASDDQSMALLCEEFVTQYDAIESNKSFKLAPTLQYSDYSEWQKDTVTEEIQESELSYWQKQLEDIPKLHSLPLDAKRPENQSFNGGKLGDEFEPELSSKIKHRCNEVGVTTFIMLQSLFSLLIARFSQQDDVVIGSPVSGRNTPELESMMGCFINSVVLRSKVEPEASFQDFLKTNKKMIVEALANQQIPYENVVSALNHDRSLSYSPVHQIRFALERGNRQENDQVGKLELEILQQTAVQTKFDLILIVTEDNNKFYLDWLYNTDIFNRSTIEQLVKSYKALIKDSLIHQNAKTSQLSLLDEEAVKKVRRASRGDSKEKTTKNLSSLMETVSTTKGNEIAVEFGDQKISFSEFNNKVNELTYYIKENHDSKTPIGLFFDRGIDVLVSIFACLRAGIPYVPLDITSPNSRNDFILRDANIKLVLAESRRTLNTSINIQQVFVDQISSGVGGESTLTKEQLNGEAYIVYTSGSTGKPKGVINTQENLRHFYQVFSEQLEELELSSNSGWLWNASYVFDASVKGLIAMSMGKRIVIPTNEELSDPRKLVSLLVQKDIEVYNGPPAMVTQLLNHLEEGVERIHLIVSGDKIDEPLWERLANYSESRNTVVLNAYGPTEATVNATYSRVESGSRPNIGRLCRNSFGVVLDKNLSLVAPSSIGELYIGGDGIANGYLGRKSLTNEKFIQYPNEDFLDLKGGRLFASGDLVRLQQDEQFEFVGRNDEQVKVRGYRIEIGEVEEQLKALEAIESTKVIPFKSAQNDNNLRAFIVLRKPEVGQKEISRGEIKQQLSLVLPEYMVPSELVILDSLPKTPGGKIDIGQLRSFTDFERESDTLPTMSEKSQGKYLASEGARGKGLSEVSTQLEVVWSSVLGKEQINQDDDFFKVGGHSLLAMKLLFDIDKTFGISLGIRDLFSHLTFQSQVELIHSMLPKKRENDEDIVVNTLSDIWKEVLQLEQVEVNDEFFKVGGHSLLAMKLLFDIEKSLGVALNVRDLFSHLTIAEQAKLIKQRKTEAGTLSDTELIGESSSLTKVVRESDQFPLSFSQQRLWFISQMSNGSADYNIPIALKVSGDFDVAVAEAAIERIIQKHEVLRTVYQDTPSGPVQTIKNRFEFKIQAQDISGLSETEKQQKTDEVYQSNTSHRFNLSDDLMIVASYLKLANSDKNKEDEQQGLLFVCLHHIASDAWSMGILIREFVNLYQSIQEHSEFVDEELPVQYVDYSVWQRNQLQGEKLSSLTNYWEKKLKDSPVLHSLPLDKPRPEVKRHVGNQIVGELPANIAERLQQVARDNDVSPFILMHACLAFVLSRFSYESEIVIGSPIANRTLKEVENLIGFFLNILVLRVKVPQGDTCFKKYLSEVKQVNLDAQSHQEASFELLVEKLNVQRSASHTPLFQVLFNMSTTEQVDLDIQGLHFSLLEGNEDTTTVVKYDLDIVADINEKGVFISWVYDIALFEQDTIEKINDYFLGFIENLALGETTHLNPTIDFNQKDTVNEPTIQTSQQTAGLTLHQQFESQVKLNPMGRAVEAQGTSLTYEQLNAAANQLAHFLDETGVESGEFVGLCVDRTIEMLVAILAIHKLGAAYLPLDPKQPKERLNWICQDAKLNWVLTESKLIEKLPISGLDVITLDNCRNVQEGPFAEYKTNNFTRPGASDDPINHLNSTNTPAYVIYTSGSTGQPKGVVVEHSQLNHYLAHCSSYYSKGNLTGAVVSTPLIFDATVTSILSPLVYGKSVKLLSNDNKKQFEELQQLIFDGDNNWLFKITPAHLQLLNTQDDNWEVCHSSHVLIIGGEQLTWNHIKPLLNVIPNGVFINEYGPTEATVGCSIFEAKQLNSESESQAVPIGKPIKNSQFFIVDQAGNQVPEGAVGQLLIGGDGVARGYLNQKDLTNSRFIENQLSLNGGKLYKSGDLVRQLNDGNLQFIGRIDEQVKVNGYRIELEEIEYRIQEAQYVVSACVIVKSNRGGDKRIIAYVVPSNELIVDGEVDLSIWNTEVRRNIDLHLSGCLPEYMVPKAIVPIKAMPLTINGKVDKFLLPDPQGVIEVEFVKPVSKVEKALCKIWARQFDLDSNTISANANFFDLGGHSLMVMKLLAAIREETNSNLTITDVFNNPTLGSLARLIEASFEIENTNTGFDSAKEKWGDCVIRLTNSHASHNVFCLHAGAGTAFVNRDIANSMQDVASFYGLQPPQIYLNKSINSLKDLAAFYVKLIKTVQPEGKYYLLGFSMGGTIAYEIATQLESEGLDVGRVFLLDTPYLSWSQDVSDKAWYFPIKRAFLGYLEVEFAFDWEVLNDKAEDEGIELLYQECVRQKISVEGVQQSQFKSYFRYFCEMYWMYADYQSEASNVDISVFTAEEKTKFTAHANQYLDWDKTTSGEVKSTKVRGGHQTMLLPPNIDQLNQSIKEQFLEETKDE